MPNSRLAQDPLLLDGPLHRIYGISPAKSPKQAQAPFGQQSHCSFGLDSGLLNCAVLSTVHFTDYTAEATFFDPASTPAQFPQVDKLTAPALSLGFLDLSLLVLLSFSVKATGDVCRGRI